MTDELGPLRFQVSGPLLELASECVRRQSNALRRLVILDEVVEDHLLADTGTAGMDPPLIADHLAALTSDGPIALSLAISQQAVRAFRAFEARLAALCGSPLSRTDALSVLLFIRLVDLTAQTALTALHKQETADRLGNMPDTDSKVVRFPR